MNQLDSLRALLTVIDLGGFAAAARALDTSPAKVKLPSRAATAKALRALSGGRRFIAAR